MKQNLPQIPREPHDDLRLSAAQVETFTDKLVSNTLEADFAAELLFDRRTPAEFRANLTEQWRELHKEILSTWQEMTGTDDCAALQGLDRSKQKHRSWRRCCEQISGDSCTPAPFLLQFF